ncbi:DUF4488 domain-containing protein [Pedobacter sp. PLR]|uniref:DUF4488 domain-containing protein n=1 Tax=Pedobacter sp. PLR TaxID=2994465 RepID=UPI002245F8B8|nr:DUF4488 domain-containing protein [Pedobacter sp. PLR]MCX2449740.1 DUF4488 domain-containing protein [Pedobacter sp. PLR]
MKNALKTIILSACLFTSISYANAQETNKTFLKGIWELDGPKVTTPDGKQLVLVHLVKIFSEDGTFQNLAFTPVESRLSHKGKFVVLDDNSYEEIIESQSAQSNGKLSGETYKLKYSFSADKNQLSLKGVIKGNDGQEKFQLNETWNRVK